jgi:predicted RNA-binding protein with PUA-like domain
MMTLLAIGNCQFALSPVLLEQRPAASRQELPSMYYLLKTEPSEYGFADLQKDRSTVWDGVSNPVALKNLRSMNKGDKLVIYHTGDERSAVGAATVESVDVTDPKTPKVKIKAGHLISHPVPLAEIKLSELFSSSPLLRQGRLSVVPLTKEQYEWLTGR